MDRSTLASGDGIVPDNEETKLVTKDTDNDTGVQQDEELEGQNITSETIEDQELKLKERIAQCKNIIESLKIQLNEEKERSNNENKVQYNDVMDSFKASSTLVDNTDLIAQEYGSTSLYSSSVDKKLDYDENLIEYEEQLQRYQNTLNMAQNEKKNAIRKQMLAKAFKLKLLEIENQCNIELLRVKQSMQCLEPLQMIANNWKCNNSAENNAMYDAHNYALMPLFPELQTMSGYDINSYKIDIDKLTTETDIATKHDSSVEE